MENRITEYDEVLMGKVVAIDSVGGFNWNAKGHDYDPYLKSFIKGADGAASNWDKEKDTTSTLVIRGLGGGSQKAIKHCWKTNREFYAIDTGYFGNWKHKRWHRITRNALQNSGPIIERSDDRLTTIMGSWNNIWKPFTPGSKILVCPPSDKVMSLWDQGTAEDWTNQLVEKIKTLTDRPIEIRMKPNRSSRVTDQTIQQALANDVHCLVTYNSIAATEALIEGKCAISLGPNAAQVIAETELNNIENPRVPSEDEMFAFMKHLSYAQFTQEEMENGFAWNTLQETIQ